tara:strand:+ start:5293 stop:5445 length:153 start_codon:yes stop_codon:yes gene_type:complete
MEILKRYKFRLEDDQTEFTISAYCEDEAKSKVKSFFTQTATFVGICDETY